MPAAATAFSHIAQIASMRRVHEAFQWLHLHEQQIMRWQTELVAIPAPPFGEQARAAWLLERFRDLGLAELEQDSAGNVFGTLSSGSAGAPSGSPPSEACSAVVLLSAHIDTVFPADTPLAPAVDGTRLSSPGACDNGAGLAGLLALAAALIHTGLEPGCDIVFAGNVGEEGEGDLRGMRHIYRHARWRGEIAAHLVLDGAGHEVAVTGALGSRRFEVALRGSGGHSWTDARRPNPIAALCRAIASMHAMVPVDAPESTGTPAERASIYRTAKLHPVANHAAGAQLPERARSAWNVGTIEGGSAVNAIPEQASARFDLRSTDPQELIRLEVELHRAVEDAVVAANDEAAAQGEPAHALSFTVTPIGSRPAGKLPPQARILELLRGVDRHLNLRTEYRTASTDANIPLSLGVEAISIGAGGEGGGIHTRGEWFDAHTRELGLRRVLLLLLALAADQPAAAS